MAKRWGKPLPYWVRVSINFGTLFLFACSSPGQILQTEKFYQRDLKVDVNGYGFRGVGVIPKSGSYRLKLRSKGEMDFVALSTCHRELTGEDKGDEWEVNLAPVNGIENEGLCPLMISTFERKRGRHSWAYFDFEDPKNTLDAKIYCNGASYSTMGVSVCQSKNGLIQEIEFPVRVAFTDGDVRCPGPVSVDPGGVRIRLATPPRICVYAFVEAESPHRVHRYTSLGYEDYLLREQ